MNILRRPPLFGSLLLIASLTLLDVSPCYSQNIQTGMLKAYEAFKGLQDYLIDNQAFEDKRNTQKIHDLLKSLSDNFHRLESLKSQYSSQPGFVSNVRVMNDMLDDALRRFDENRKVYAFWRVRTISAHCITCHTTYGIGISFADKDLDISQLDDLQRGNFYLASRQFKEAELAFYAAASNPALKLKQIDALRHWLLIYIRVYANPKEALSKLKNLDSLLTLYKDEQGEVADWVASLKEWSREGPQSGDKLALAERLIKRSLRSADPLSVEIDEVKLIRGSAMIHDLLVVNKLAGASRSKALYLLGLSYSKLPSFFIDELPDTYLVQCIDEFPGSDDAKRAFKLYRELVMLAFSGSGGTEFPTDVRVKLMELHDKAFNVVKLDGRV